jgi:regulator of replication initiation timing
MANEAHALRLENERLRDAICTITRALETLQK